MKSLPKLLSTGFADWFEGDSAGEVSEVVDDLTMLTPLARSILGDSLVNAQGVIFAYSFNKPVSQIVIATVLYPDESEKEINISLKELIQE